MNKMISVVRHPQNKKNVWTWAQLHNQAVVKSLNCSLKHEKLKIQLSHFLYEIDYNFS